MQVTKAHAGDYTCTPYNTHGTSGTSGVMQVHVRDPPSIKLRPEEEYVRTVGEKVTFPCSASGTSLSAANFCVKNSQPTTYDLRPTT